MKKLKSFLLILLAMLVLTGCDQNKIGMSGSVIAGSGDESQTVDVKQSAEKLGVYYFHRTQRCISCMTIGEYINKTMLEFYQDEMAGGKIDYKEINIDLSENKDLARKFQTSGSSLYINAIRGEHEDIQNILEIWNWKSNEEIFKSNLKQKIDNLLGK